MFPKPEVFAPMDCIAGTPLTCDPWDATFGAPTLVEQQQQVQLNDLHSKVATLLQRVDSLKRSIPRSTHWTCRHCNDTIVHGPTEPCPKLRNTSRSPSDLSTQEEGPGSTTAMSTTPTSTLRFASSDAARRLPKSNGVYRPSLHWLPRPREPSVDLKQLQAARKMAMQVNMAKFPSGNFSTILRMALQSTDRFRESLPKASTFPVIWDSGASISILLTARTLYSGQPKDAQGPSILGVLHQGQAPIHHKLAPSLPGETITIEAHQLTLSGTSDEARGQLIARVNPDNNLPTSDAHRSSDTPKAVAALNITLNTVHESNLNLTEAEKELLRWHRLGHLSFRKIQFIMRTGVLSRKHLNTHETLKAKQNFELMARDSGVIPQSYLSDNGGSFTSAKFTEHLGTLKQVVKFAGVGAHHHNGHAERAIKRSCRLLGQ
ncbi:hypothetical protein MHU86_25586 [Fragilaria crotonensis]|nr:hypothetical protein MHU86_25586 [Fragilaria crotonensis]